MLKKLLRLIYRLGLRKPYPQIDALQYLKRLARTKSAGDEWYFSEKDAEQFVSGDEVLRYSHFRGAPILFGCNLVSHVEQRIVRDGLYGREVLDLMCDMAKPDTHVIDVGANIGCYAIPFAKVRGDCTLHAVEPNPMALQRLQHNLALNAGVRVLLHNVGLAEQPGKLTFYAYGGESGDLGLSSFIAPASDSQVGPLPVEVVTLDGLLGDNPPVSLIKIDVQGFEINVLSGAIETIRRNRPVILLEHEDINFADAAAAQHAKEGLNAFFRAIDYGVYYITRYDPGLLLPVDWGKALNGNLLALPRADPVVA